MACSNDSSKVWRGLPLFGELLFSQKLFALQLGNALLIGRHNRAAARIHDAIKELIKPVFQAV